MYEDRSHQCICQVWISLSKVFALKEHAAALKLVQRVFENGRSYGRISEQVSMVHAILCMTIQQAACPCGINGQECSVRDYEPSKRNEVKDGVHW